MRVARIIGPAFSRETILRACDAFGCPPTEDVQQAITNLFAELYMAGWDECSRRYEDALAEDKNEKSVRAPDRLDHQPATTKG